MSITKTKRPAKKQLGQFLTPSHIASDIVATLSLNKSSVVLEPSSGDGSFLIPLIRLFMSMHDEGSPEERLAKIVTENIFAIEIDPVLYQRSIARIEKEFGKLPSSHNLIRNDFFNIIFGNTMFDFIVGNPPFGGTINPLIQDKLDRKYGKRNGIKIKKETYSFFTVACIELLKPKGQLKFICSDTFLTISTMKGLREFLINRGHIKIDKLNIFSEETNWPMVVLDFILNGSSDEVIIDENKLNRKTINLTGNKSWKIRDQFAHFFTGKKLSDFMVASSGMTIGRNEYFLREIKDNKIEEHYDFEFFDDPITLMKEREQARLGKLSEKQISYFKRLEEGKQTKRNVRLLSKQSEIIELPNKNYCYYNKANPGIVYTPPRYVIFWKDDGDAVFTFKKNGNWYLRGVGGKQFFKQDGITWQLIASTLNVRYLPCGYILDSGAPCAFLRNGIDRDELWFILGWTLTNLCTQILKEVINHTRNIQSKDFEKLPYPFWIENDKKQIIIKYVKELVNAAMYNNQVFDKSHSDIIEFDKLYKF